MKSTASELASVTKEAYTYKNRQDMYITRNNSSGYKVNIKSIQNKKEYKGQLFYLVLDVDDPNFTYFTFSNLGFSPKN